MRTEMDGATDEVFHAVLSLPMHVRVPEHVHRMWEVWKRRYDRSGGPCEGISPAIATEISLFADLLVGKLKAADIMPIPQVEDKKAKVPDPVQEVMKYDLREEWTHVPQGTPITCVWRNKQKIGTFVGVSQDRPDHLNVKIDDSPYRVIRAETVKIAEGDPEEIKDQQPTESEGTEPEDVGTGTPV